MIRLQRRASPSPAMSWLAPVLALMLTVLTAALIFFFNGVSLSGVFEAWFVEPLGSKYGLSELMLKAAPLIMIAVALSLGFRCQVWNIGAEGQLIVGALTGASVALLMPEVEALWLLPLMALAAMFGGMAWAAIPALLRTRFNANEILVSLMLSYVATLLLSLMVHGPLRDPDGFNFPQSRMLQDAATLPRIWDGTRLHIGAPLALALALAAWLLLSRTLLGYAIRVNGQAPRAASWAGFSQARLTWFVLLFAGASAGLAGLFEVAGPIGQLQPVISPGYGFTAIIVAFLGRLHPIGVVPAGLVMALSYLGGENAQITLGLPMAVTGVFQGMLLFFLLAADVLIHYRLRFGSGHASKAAA